MTAHKQKLVRELQPRCAALVTKKYPAMQPRRCELRARIDSLYCGNHQRIAIVAIRVVIQQRRT